MVLPRERGAEPIAGHNFSDRALSEVMQLLHEVSDNELLRLAAEDAEAFGAFYDRHAVALIGALRHRTGSAELAMELAAETFAVALERCGSFVPRDENSARGWLYTIAQNKLIDSARRATAADDVCRRLGIALVALDEEAMELLEQQIDAAASGVLAALDQLPPGEREAVHARVLDEADYREIADRQQVSQQVVRQRVSRGLRRLRVSLKEQS